MDALQKAAREGKLRRLVNNVEAQVHEELGKDATFALVVVERTGLQKSVVVLSGIDEDALPVVLGQAVRSVRGDG